MIIHSHCLFDDIKAKVAEPLDEWFKTEAEDESGVLLYES